MISILIPARNEPYLQKTIDDLLEHAETEIEILVGLDGYDAHVAGPNCVRVIRSAKPIGQRAMLNKLAQEARGEYLMKVDAHCSFGQGYDRIMLEDFEDDMAMAPTLLSLDAETWEARPKPTSSAYYFDKEMVFQYHREAENNKPLNETMCLQGSCFLVTKKMYFELNLCDEAFGSWGSQGVEIGCKVWLSGGRCVTNKRTYYAHLFRENDEAFPYQRNMEQVRGANALAKEIFLNDRWPLAKKKLTWIINKFKRPGDWGSMV